MISVDRQDFLTYAKSEIKSGSIKDFVSSIDCKLSSGTIQEKCDVVVPLDEDLYDDLVTLQGCQVSQISCETHGF